MANNRHAPYNTKPLASFDLGSVCMACGALGIHQCKPPRPTVTTGHYGAITVTERYSDHVAMSAHRTDI